MQDDLLAKLRQAVIDGLHIIKLAVERNRGVPWFWDTSWEYPTLDFFDNGLPRVTKTSKVDYVSFFYKEEVRHSIPSWDEYKQYVLGSEELCQHFQIGNFLEEALKSNLVSVNFWNDIPTFSFLARFTNSYIHLYSLEFSEESFLEVATRYLNSIGTKKLSIDIHIPILLLKFDFDYFEISDRVCIQKIKDNYQLSRNRSVKDVYTAHPTITGAATHAFVLQNWQLDNNPIPIRTDHPLSNISSYTEVLEITQQLFASLRLSDADVETGFCQIFTTPNDWQTSFFFDLPQTFTASEKNYPTYFEDYGWLWTPQCLTVEHAEKMKIAYAALTSASHLDLAWRRLNKASLNNRDDDAIIDISIALEALLTSDSKTELTYKLATRASLLNKILPFGIYSSEEIFQICKKLYDFRSSVVHGDKKRHQKSRVIRTGENEEIIAVSLGLRYLKHLLWTLINNPELDAPVKIDKLLF